MNDQKIEKLLRHAPRVAAPKGLLEELKREIPSMRTAAAVPGRGESVSLLRRWFPAISFATFFIVCLAVLGVQTTAIYQLKKENESLRTATRELDELRAGAGEFRKVSMAGDQLEQLRKDHQELQKLRAEAEALRSQLAGMDTLRAEKERLLAETAAKRSLSGNKADEEFFNRAEEKATRIQCINNLKQVGLAARMWANENKKEFLPSELSSLTAFAPSKTLACPGSGMAYIILSPGASENQPEVVFAQCPTHGTVVLVDGSVQALSGDRTVILKNNRYVIGVR